jgi:uroporphyrinogen decarboxylase
MNPRENLHRTLNRRGFDYVPVDFKLCHSQVETFKRRFGHKDYQTFFGLSHREVEIPLKLNYTDGRKQFFREQLPADTEFDEYGIGHSKGSEFAFHMTRMHHPLKGCESLDEIANYPLPEVDNAKLSKFKQEIDKLHDNGLAAFGFMQMTVWEASWYLRSMEELMMDMMMGDEKATLLLDRITEYGCSKARAYAECGADILSLGDDIGTQNSIMMDVGMWEEWLKPRLQKVIQAARLVKPDVLIFYHSCGYITPFLEGLIDVGVDILNPIQPECMSFDEVHDMVGDRLSFWGTIGTQRLLPFGTSEEVQATVLSRLEKCGGKGGIVIGPTHLIEPEVPWENLMALYGAAKKFSGTK